MGRFTLHPPRAKDGGKLSLSFILIVPFILQIFAVVALTTTMALRNSQKTVDDLVNQLQVEVGDRIDVYLRSYTDEPHRFLDSTVAMIEAGLLDPSDRDALERYFWYQGERLPSAELLYFGRVDGTFQGVERNTADRQDVRWRIDRETNGDLVRQVIVQPGQLNAATFDRQSGFDPRNRPWYLAAIASGRSTWSSIYADAIRPILTISTARPLRNQRDELIGVLSVDFDLSQIGEFFTQLDVGEGGQVFAIERSGELVASSDRASLFSGRRRRPERVAALASDNPQIRRTAYRLLKEYGSFAAINKRERLVTTFGNSRQFITVQPFRDGQGLDWLVAIAIPEVNFTARVRESTRNAILLCFGALAVAALVGAATAGWVTRPILAVIDAARGIASTGKIDRQVVSAVGIGELEGLGEAFNQMSRRLKDAFEELEIRVQVRTFELWEAKESADRAKEAATTASRAKSEFLASMSHELRTPLNGILGYAQILQRDRDLSSQQRHSIDTIYNCGAHLLTLIEDVLDLSKIEAQRMELRPTTFSLPAFLQTAADMCRVRAEKKGIDFRYETRHLPTMVYADDKRLRQVLLNLLGNAIKFSQRGSVTLSVMPLGEPIREDNGDDLRQPFRFQVSDTGIGISPQELSKIFQPFEQVGDRESQDKGTGLGLAIGQKIVALMGSRIQVTSEPGKGSTFWFDLELPVGNVVTSGVGAGSHGDGVHGNGVHGDGGDNGRLVVGYRGARRTVVVIDDREANRELIAGLLLPLGFNLQKAASGQQFLEQLTQRGDRDVPDVVILDLNLPDGRGENLIAQLRPMESFKTVPIIVWSASVFAEDRDRSLQVGATDFLAKPLQASELFSQLQQYLELQWIYQEVDQTHHAVDAAAPAEGDRGAAGTAIVPPDVSLVEALFELAMRGNANKLQEEADRLEASDPSLQPFAHEVRRLARSFQVRELRSFLERYR